MIRFMLHGYSMRRFTAGVVVGDKVGLPCIACARVNQKFFLRSGVNQVDMGRMQMHFCTLGPHCSTI
jgi:hypothetical protein